MFDVGSFEARVVKSTFNVGASIRKKKNVDIAETRNITVIIQRYIGHSDANEWFVWWESHDSISFYKPELHGSLYVEGIRF